MTTSQKEKVHCAGLRLLEEENRVTTLKAAIQEGIDSGIAKNFNPKKHLKTLKVNL